MAGQLGRHLDQARQRARRLHHGDRRLAAEGVGAGQRHDEIQALVVDARKRVRRIQSDGGQERHHVADEDLVRPFLLLRVPFRGMVQGDALGLHGRQDLVVEQRVLPRHQLMDGALHVVEGLIRGHAVRANQVGRLALLLLEAGNPDLEELVQVGAEDAHVAQTLQQGSRGTFRHRQHAFVEFEQRQLSIQQPGLCGRACGHTRFHT